ncbi:pimeloyl-ACP methyl ester carboxylesterase [Actinomycetospora succinea]|uniref:Pimeloyl-ACP methyl ester carboxylesterase n=1 Tax=Actinomycetospora succinea TaxID=663603 RepID=A0A4R6VLG8_9PSEU|nr:alpha/beta hydrolase [Actinomycetospora succinea]TDQ62731.1 pimeloyl-ACP methyl ester carboxylesterase [Actinomycetospora succinea]
MATIAVNGTTLYYELRGEGPPVVFISGGPGDAGFWPETADLLADGFTVLSYDRRGTSRSPRPEGWTSTSIDEQADDAAALLEALDLAPAVAYGHSAGGLILTSLAMRRPELLRGAVFHEPAFLTVTPEGRAVIEGLQGTVADAMARGGPPLAMELFLRWADGDEVYEAMDPAFRARMLDDGEVLFGVEMEALMGYLPTPDQLSRITVPSVVLGGAENREPDARLYCLYAAGQWAADGLGVPLVETPGAHLPQATHLREYVAIVRPILARLAASAPVEA